MEKTVFISFLKPPISTSFHLEGIRIALGILSGDESHEVTVAYMGKGVRCALKGVDTSYTKGMLDLLKKGVAGGHFYAEKESLDSERIPEGDIDEAFAVVPRKRLQELMGKADVTLSF
ncbi:MAG: DsrE family protein [Nitrososphaerota archaeon]|nr:DsrE family protein [Nitrososphaerota archaeon]